jgi:hypothetical protein
MTTVEQLELAVVSVTNFVDANLKRVALDECLEDLDEGYWQGTLTAGQRRRLIAILLGLEAGPESRGGSSGHLSS